MGRARGVSGRRLDRDDPGAGELGAAVPAGRDAAQTPALDALGAGTGARGVGARRPGLRGILGDLFPTAARLAAAAGNRLAGAGRIRGAGGRRVRGAAFASRRVHPADEPGRRGGPARHLSLQHGTAAAVGVVLARFPRDRVRRCDVLGRPGLDAGDSAPRLGALALPGGHDDRAGRRGLRAATNAALARLGVGDFPGQPGGKPWSVHQPDLADASARRGHQAARAPVAGQGAGAPRSRGRGGDPAGWIPARRRWQHLLADGDLPARFSPVPVSGQALHLHQPGTRGAGRSGLGLDSRRRLAAADRVDRRTARLHRGRAGRRPDRPRPDPRHVPGVHPGVALRPI